MPCSYSATSRSTSSGRTPEAPRARLAILSARTRRTVASSSGAPVPAACERTMLVCSCSRSPVAIRVCDSRPNPVLMPYAGLPLATMRSTARADSVIATRAAGARAIGARSRAGIRAPAVCRRSELSRFHGWSSPSPHASRSLEHHVQLTPLLVFGEQIARNTGGEAALRAEREVLERKVPARLVDPSAELVHRLEAPGLGGDQPEHRNCALPDEAQGSKTAGALGVVLEQQPVVFEAAKERFGDA